MTRVAVVSLCCTLATCGDSRPKRHSYLPGQSDSGDAGPGDSPGGDEGTPGDVDITGPLDPAPEYTTPGAHGGAGCPTVAEPGSFSIDVGNDTFHLFSGVVQGASGPGTFYVASGPSQEIVGPIETGNVSECGVAGCYSLHAPLFCGDQVVKLIWTNATCDLVLVYAIRSTACTKMDLRMTLVWDALGDDFELHLIKPGGHINEHSGDGSWTNDCTWDACPPDCETCVADWGTPGVTTDDPRKDVDDTTAYGPESIYLGDLADSGVYTIMVEHWGSGGSPQADGAVVINVAGGTTIVEITDLPPHWVREIATIAPGGAGLVPSTDPAYDCTATWNMGCEASLP